jgi:hypothetical protein
MFGKMTSLLPAAIVTLQRAVALDPARFAYVFAIHPEGSLFGPLPGR